MLNEVEACRLPSRLTAQTIACPTHLRNAGKYSDSLRLMVQMWHRRGYWEAMVRNPVENTKQFGQNKARALLTLGFDFEHVFGYGRYERYVILIPLFYSILFVCYPCFSLMTTPAPRPSTPQKELTIDVANSSPLTGSMSVWNDGLMHSIVPRSHTVTLRILMQPRITHDLFSYSVLRASLQEQYFPPHICEI